MPFRSAVFSKVFPFFVIFVVHSASHVIRTASPTWLLAVPCLHAHYKIGQDQDNRRIGTRPNQGREPPLVWSVEFVKQVHVASNDTAPLTFPWWKPPGASSGPAAWPSFEEGAWGSFLIGALGYFIPASRIGSGPVCQLQSRDPTALCSVPCCPRMVRLQFRLPIELPRMPPKPTRDRPAIQAGEKRAPTKATITTRSADRSLPYSGITCMVAVPGTGPGIATGAGGGA